MLRTAAAVQAGTLVVGVVSLVGAAGAYSPGGDWYIFDAAGLAIVATAMIFTAAVTRSQAVRSLAPRLQDRRYDDEGL